MDQLLAVTNIKNESTDSTSNDRRDVPTEMNMNSVKQNSDCVVQPEIYIKTEPQENESVVPIIEDTFYEMCSYNNIKFTTIKIEYENPEEHIMQDPLDVGNEMKVEEHIPIELGIETQLTQEGKDENLLKTDQDSLHGRISNQSQDHILIRNDSHCKDIKYICYVCNRIFTLKSKLDKHLSIHRGEKPFACEICKKSFNRKASRDRHMYIHTGKRPLICNVCGKGFYQKGHYDYHKLIHSGEKPFSCNECDKSFKTKREVFLHKRIHTGDKPFTCELCKKTFATTSNLIRHKFLHTGQKPFSCNICNKSFAQKTHLKQHNKIHKNQ